MRAGLPTQCDVGVKRNSKGFRETWIGYKLHLDTADGIVPVAAILTAASTHDSQVAIPLARTSEQRVVWLYDLMDPAYDAQLIILNPAVGFELRDGFAAVYNQCGQLTPGQGAAAGVVGGLSGNVAVLR